MLKKEEMRMTRRDWETELRGSRTVISGIVLMMGLDFGSYQQTWTWEVRVYCCGFEGQGGLSGVVC